MDLHREPPDPLPRAIFSAQDASAVAIAEDSQLPLALQDLPQRVSVFYPAGYRVIAFAIPIDPTGMAQILMKGAG